MDPAVFIPALNASLNGAATILLVSALFAVKAGKLKLHRALMMGAVIMSLAFLAGYLTYHLGFHLTKRYEGPHRWAYLYLLLLPHTILAAALLPLVPLTLWGAWKGQKNDGELKSPNLRENFAFHRRMAKWTFPIWLYVSATGVLIYLILYQFYP
jgi:uncharacterized membrane protein YozB (DUF420 family)